MHGIVEESGRKKDASFSSFHEDKLTFSPITSPIDGSPESELWPWPFTEVISVYFQRPLDSGDTGKELDIIIDLHLGLIIRLIIQTASQQKNARKSGDITNPHPSDSFNG